MKSGLGFTFFALGVAIAVTGGAKAPLDGATWPDTLLVFAVGVGFAIIGLTIWWRAEWSAQASNVQKGSNQGSIDPIIELKKLHADLVKLSNSTHTHSLDSLRTMVDSIKSQRMYAIIESKQLISGRFGMTEAAEIMINFAYCERMLNRVWSAAADGHQKEALSSLQDAVNASALIANRLPASSAMELSEEDGEV